MNNQEENHGYESLKKGILAVVYFFKISVIGLIISFCVSGFFSVEKNETAFILRLGTVHKKINKQGISFALPKPVDRIIKISKRLQTISDDKFMFNKSSTIKVGRKLTISPELNPVDSGYLITKDKNIIHLESNLTYQITEPINYSIKTNDSSKHLLFLLNNLLIKKVANKTFEETFSTKKFSIEIKENLQKHVDELNLGVEIINLNLQIYYPRQVELDYLTVNKQKDESSQIITEAHSFANQLRTQGNNEAIKIISEAKNFHANLIGKTKDTLIVLDEFKKRYKTDNEITKKLILYERFGKLLKKIKQTFIIPQNYKELRINIDKPTDWLHQDDEEKTNE